MSTDVHPADRRPTDREVKVILQRAGRIQDWEARAGQAFDRLRRKERSAVDVCAAYDRWLEEGREAFGPNCPIKTVTGYAIWAFPEGDNSEAALGLRKRFAFMGALTEIAMRVHHTYMDEMLETNRGGAYYALEIDAEAIKYGAERGYDPALATEAMDHAVRTYLGRAGRDIQKRELISGEALAQAFREGISEMTEGFANHMQDKHGVRVSPVRLGRFEP